MLFRSLSKVLEAFGIPRVFTPSQNKWSHDRILGLLLGSNCHGILLWEIGAHLNSRKVHWFIKINGLQRSYATKLQIQENQTAHFLGIKRDVLKKATGGDFSRYLIGFLLDRFMAPDGFYKYNFLCTLSGWADN